MKCSELKQNRFSFDIHYGIVSCTPSNFLSAGDDTHGRCRRYCPSDVRYEIGGIDVSTLVKSAFTQHNGIWQLTPKPISAIRLMSKFTLAKMKLHLMNTLQCCIRRAQFRYCDERVVDIVASTRGQSTFTRRFRIAGDSISMSFSMRMLSELVKMGNGKYTCNDRAPWIFCVTASLWRYAIWMNASLFIYIECNLQRLRVSAFLSKSELRRIPPMIDCEWQTEAEFRFSRDYSQSYTMTNGVSNTCPESERNCVNIPNALYTNVYSIFVFFSLN